MTPNHFINKWVGRGFRERQAARTSFLARSPELTISMRPGDSDKYGILDGEWVAPAAATSRVTLITLRGSVPESFSAHSSSSGNTSPTSSPAPPRTPIPEYKVCAVRIDKVGEDRSAFRPRQPVSLQTFHIRLDL